VKGGLGGVGEADLAQSFSHMSYVVCVSRPNRNGMCNGSGAKQDWTGINWPRMLYPIAESHGGEILATSFLLL
jgi:hypothetical protein